MLKNNVFIKALNLLFQLKEILDLRLDELRKKLDIVREDLERDKCTVSIFRTTSTIFKSSVV